MSQSPETRSRQHLLLQGFTLYTCESACCMLLSGSLTLLDPAHAWAVEFDATSWQHTDRLPPDAGLAQQFAAAAEACRQQGTRGVLCHTQGSTLFVPLDAPSVRDARMRIEAAIMLGKQPPAERLEAFADEMLAREARRRGLIPKEVGAGGGPGRLGPPAAELTRG